ncbi:hypothetical protein HK405_009616, partial [Cladochytrium tenue]
MSAATTTPAATPQQRREDNIALAVKFLSDAKVQQAPLAKRVSFLESKGLAADEIEDALARVAGKAPATSSSATTAAAAVAPPPPPVPAYVAAASAAAQQGFPPAA